MQESYDGGAVYRIFHPWIINFREKKNCKMPSPSALLSGMNLKIVLRFVNFFLIANFPTFKHTGEVFLFFVCFSLVHVPYFMIFFG